jgi:cytochrome c-type biogenesis protein CcmH/NrfG
MKLVKHAKGLCEAKLPYFQLLLLMMLTASSAFADRAGVPMTDTEAMVAEGDRLWEEGDLDAAIRRFRAAAEADPHSVDARMRLGGVYLAKNDFTAGVKAFQQAIGIDPGNANAYIALGIAYLHGSNDGPAHAAFSEAIRLDPSRFKSLEPIMKQLEARQGQSMPDTPPAGFMGPPSSLTISPTGS